ncbi:GntP family permease [Meridianimarinicoccus aquatilis]|uniref:GntP family permease n=1 Tax=Meridianimarinicoccus aquatilis TaxID=2552766 RepID=A0A4R6AXN8_9RHOB|nr:GntP family permease [Fluviibacterium aquatile]QIE40736.1 GntP family permease [Rhodobacteraceae bacterium SC52]TDL89050.1 GntP family permease [Fluviibacterium aquatile]
MLGIILSLFLLMYLAYRGVSVLILAPVLSLLAAALSGGSPLLATYTQIFMAALGGYVVKFFPLFLLGAIFGKLMEVSGSARVIAEWIVARVGQSQSALAVVLACGVLTYGGVSLFVVAFAVYPIAAALFSRAGNPKRFIPAAIALGSFTFTMTALPGTPAIQNAIPAPFFGTDAFAAPLLGLVAAAIMFGGGVGWLNFRIRQAVAAGADYGETDDYSDAPAFETDLSPRAVILAFLPIVVVIGLNFLLSRFVFPAMNTAYLETDKFGNVTLDDVRGIWAIIAALFAANVVLVAANWKTFDGKLNETLTAGVTGSFLPIFNTASEVGYGTVIASLAAFATIREAVTGIMPDTPLVSLAIAVNVLAGITGSASGGLSIALESLGSTYVQMAEAVNLSPELLHRVAAIASGGFDCLPHNGAVITLLAITGLNHRKSYPDLFVVAVLIPVVALVSVIVLGSIFGAA